MACRRGLLAGGRKRRDALCNLFLNLAFVRPGHAGSAAVEQWWNHVLNAGGWTGVNL